MANYSSNYNFTLYEDSDSYSVDGINSNFQTIDDVLGGYYLMPPCTQEEYDAMSTHRSNGLYIIVESS